MIKAVLFFGIAAVAAGQGAHSKLVVEVRTPVPPEALPFAVGGRSPGGQVLSANSRYLLLDGKPWFPVMGEFHYTRFPAEGWEEEILKMKAGGVRIVSTYVFWIHHEEAEGQFDWSGRRDLRRFIQICARNGMYAWVRIGPWAHGEVRNGGLPDWLLEKAKVRENDPAYLKYAGRFYGQIGMQLKGLYWKDGGPVIGVQLENEYHSRGPGRGVEHMQALRELAAEAGIDPPFWSATAWDDAAIPPRGFLPVFGGYADAFWDRRLTDLPPSPNYFFTGIRCEENVADDLRSKSPEVAARYQDRPYLTAEMGGGMEVAYHRRPLMSADDTAAMELVKLGSGVTLYGYYMFHGGTNPDGRKTTLQESQATGYPQDLPLKSYDFQAPLGEFGQMHESFRDLKTFHLFLDDFGADLAPMVSYLPDRRPPSREDREVSRIAVRSDGSRAFLFINNYQRNPPLPARRGFQVRVKLASGAVDVPREPVAIPAGAYTFWPVNQPVDHAVLEYATAQVLCKLDDSKTLVFFAWPGIAPEFSFRAGDGIPVEAPRGRVRREGGRVFVDQIEPGLQVAVRVGSTQILVLSREQARNTWKAALGGRERLILSAADLFFESGRIHLRSTDPARLTLDVFPAPDGGIAGLERAGREGVFERYEAKMTPVAIAAEVRRLADAGETAPVKMGKEVALAPGDDEFASAGRWSVRVPKVTSPDVSNVILRINYQGDVARLYAGGRLVTDDFFRGAPWEIGLAYLPERNFELKILPLRQDAPIYLGAGVRPEIPAGGQLVKLEGVQAVPEYQATGLITEAAMLR